MLPLLLLVAACDTPAPAPPPEPAPPSILLVTLDTTRADRIGAYGYARGRTPTLDGLAQEGALFQRAYSTAPLTIPSHSTILTGRNPPSHGVRDNGDFNLGPSEITLAERLAPAGYTCAAFTAAFPTQARWGFDQGFHLYHDPLERPPSQLDWRDERRAEEVVDDALASLAGLEPPLFVWLHFFDPHWPYDPPEPYAPPEGAPPNAAYDGEIAYTDAQLGRFLTWWDDQLPRSWVLVTADHGEGLGDGGERTHGFLLHDGTIRVPLIVRGEGFAPGSQVEQPVSHIDIAPTLLSLADLQPHPGLEGRDLRLGGTSRAYSEALTGQYNLGLAPLLAYTDQDGRYAEGARGDWYARQGARVALEPDQDWQPGDEAEKLASLLAAMDQGSAPSASLAPDALEQLMALGYVGGDAIAEPGDVDPRDVIDIVPLTWQARSMIGRGNFQRAELLLARLDERLPGTYGVDLLWALMARRKGQLREATERFADLFLRSPSATVALHLADLAAMTTDWVEAESWYVQALEIQPASPEAMAGLVRATLMLGDLEQAEILALSYLDAYPDHAELRLIRAEMALARGRLEEARAEAEAGLQRLPGSVWAHTLTAQVLWELGEADPAIERLQDALRLDPYSLSTRGILCDCLLEVGRNAEALRTVKPMARLFPEDQALATLYERARAALEAERAR